MDPNLEISNLDLPIAKRIKEVFNTLSVENKKEVLEAMTEDEFISHRVDIYLEEYSRAATSGFYSRSGVEEIAVNESMGDLMHIEED